MQAVMSEALRIHTDSLSIRYVLEVWYHHDILTFWCHPDMLQDTIINIHDEDYIFKKGEEMMTSFLMKI